MAHRTWRNAACGMILLAACLASPRVQAAAEPDRPLNVLFIVVDDLRPILGCYGDERVKSPRIDMLASEGLRFDRAYCQYALCNPSRASLLAGRRPESLEIFTLAKFVRDGHPDVVTLPEHFKAHGYETRSYGKIFHVTNGNHDDPQSWSRPPWPARKPAAANAPAGGPKTATSPAPASATADHSDDDPADSPDVADDELLDGRIAAEAVAALGELQGRPFFLAVGFHKPHLPFIAPKRYWDLYDRSEFPPPADDALPRGAPAYASNDSSELRRYKGVPPSGPPVSAEEASRLIHGYHACVSCTDAQLGRVLDELERLGLEDDTVVVLFGDHGYHLAEKGTWTKRTAWELATRVPLVIRLPQRLKAAHDSSTDRLVELLDLYPTLVELCGLPQPAGLEGRSLVPLLNQPDAAWPHVARSIITRSVPELGKGTITGRAVRTDRYRWVEWTGGPLTEPVHELYDHETDPLETVNLAASADGQRVIAELRAAHGPR